MPKQRKPKVNFDDLYASLQANVTDGMLEYLAGSLDVTIESIRILGVGYYPKGNCWVTPERDEKGKLIGLSKRLMDGRKFMWEGSKRGLCYPVNGEKENVGNLLSDYVRVTEAGVQCPICGKGDWCLVSRDNPAHPSRAICPRPIGETGAVRKVGDAGWLHVFGKTPNGANQPFLRSGKPVIVVEGYSDTAAALDLGFDAVGRPGAMSGTKMLKNFLSGQKEIIVVGENDDGAGQKGMDSIFNILKRVCKDVRKVLPPIGIKDLRSWVNKVGLTQESFLEYVNAHAESEADLDYFESFAPLYVAGRYLRDNDIIIRHHRDTWWVYRNGIYQELELSLLDEMLYVYLEHKYTVNDKNGEITKYEPDETKVRKTRHALASLTQIPNGKNAEEPFLIQGHKNDIRFSPTEWVIFKNGILSTETGEMQPLSPELFTTSTLPFDYDPKATCPTWEKVVNEWFASDRKSVTLLAQWFGYNLLCTNYLQKMMIFFGPPGSGKSTVTNILTELLGKENCVPLEFIDLNYAFGLEPMVGKRAVILSEDRVTKSVDGSAVLSMIKRITGDNYVNIRQKFKSTFSTKLYTRLTYETNELPRFVDNAQALQRRINVLYFGRTFTNNPDVRLFGKLKKEIPGIANWALKGLRYLIKDDKFVQPDSSKRVEYELQLMTSPIAAMADECLEFTDATCLLDLVYDLHRAWFKENGYSLYNRAWFKRVFSNTFRNCEIIKDDDGIQYVKGVKLLDAARRNYLEG